MKNKDHKHSHVGNNPGEDAARPQEPAAGQPGDVEPKPAQHVEAGTPHVEPPAQPTEQAKKEFDDRLLRLHADFDNFRKRVLKEKAEIYHRANEDILNELLPVLDHMDMALKSAAEHNAPPAITDGFKLVAEQLFSVVGKFGLVPFDVEGKPFDPLEQAAVSHLPSDTVPENIVITQTRRGYKLGGRLFRPAEAVVSSGKQPPVETGADMVEG
jgi:molecular chaperone GrpE